jgi:asparagine synthase (glutamine-hydrolysing)
MCGIAGLVGPRDCEARARAVIDTTLAMQHVRGPDNSGTCQIDLNDHIALLGHNRLSIIDLSHAGDQPMVDTDGHYTITYNGEIYNYLELKKDLESVGASFRTQSDTEVILEAYKYWGPDCLQRFNGMFAFAIVDEPEQRLLLARDRFGVKPLYFIMRDTVVSFASSARALAAEFGCPPCLEYVARGAIFGVFEDGNGGSPFEGVSSLEPGTSQCIAFGREGLSTVRHRYYDLAERAVTRAADLSGRVDREIIEELDHTLKDAVALRLRADVPVAVSLSGGLDSSLVAAEAARQGGEITGFCYGSPDDGRSEGAVVARFARFANVAPEYIWTKLDRDSVCEAFERTLCAQEAPFGSASIIAQQLVFQRVRAREFKVLLGGQGGDEGFLGYRKFAVFAVADAWRRGRLASLVRASKNLALMMLGEARQIGIYWQNRHRLVGSTAQLRMLRLQLPVVGLGFSNGELFSERQMRDVLEVSLPTLLRFEDRNSMGNSVESRLPFMDYRVVEFGVAMPLAMKLKGGFGKWCLREIARDRLPAEIRLNRLKRGFDVTQDWVTGGLGAHFRHRISQAIPKLRDLLRANANPDEVFSDHYLRTSARSFAEAVGIIWLADQIS